MAYSTPATWTAGEIPTAAKMNQQVRDNVSFLANPPACRVRRTTAQTGIVTATETAIGFDAERYDTASMHDNATNNSRIVFPVAGIYIVGCHIQWDNNATGFRALFVRLNGATRIAPEFRTTNNGDVTEMGIVTTYKFAASDYIEFTVYQTSGANRTLNLASGASAPEAWATWYGLG